MLGERTNNKNANHAPIEYETSKKNATISRKKKKEQVLNFFVLIKYR